MSNRWKHAPLIVAGATTVLVVTAMLTASYFRLRAVDPRVTIEFGQNVTAKQAQGSQNGIATNMDGEVSRTADRIGEATALALAAGLYAATEQLRGRTPRGVGDLVAGVSSKGLLPPGLAPTEAEGTLVSAYGAVSIRYRPAPLAIEIVSLGKTVEYGPALIVRVPDESSDRGETKLYIAGSLEEVKAPAPFAPAAEVIALGWSPERLRSLR